MDVEMITSEQVRNAALRCYELGAEEAYSSWPGGSVRAPDGASAELSDAVAQYHRLAAEHDRQVNGPARRYYYFGP